MYCDAEWGRPYEYRDHLERYHPDVDPDLILGKAAGSRRKSACFARHRSQQASLPTIEHIQRGHSEIMRYIPALVEPSTITLSAPDMTYVPRHEPTQPIMASKSIPEGAVNWIILCYLFSLSFYIHRRTCANGLDGSMRRSPGWICRLSIQLRNDTFHRPHPDR